MVLRIPQEDPLPLQIVLEPTAITTPGDNLAVSPNVGLRGVQVETRPPQCN
jgi:hypothetical protein